MASLRIQDFDNDVRENQQILDDMFSHPSPSSSIELYYFIMFMFVISFCIFFRKIGRPLPSDLPFPIILLYLYCHVTNHNSHSILFVF